jgi:glycosyltransferase involved in cell wall biosynthesis
VPLNKISIIGNGIDPSSFVGTPSKVKGKFIFSSAPERGLQELLDNWHKIKQILPHATLDVFTPGYSLIDKKYNLHKYDGVMGHGTVDQLTLHDAILRAEYWCYITDYEETYCITALEMQYAKVLPIVTRVAALNETVNSGIILDRNETTWQSVVQLLDTLGNELKNKAIEDAFQWAKCQTWNARSYDWKSTLESI